LFLWKKQLTNWSTTAKATVTNIVPNLVKIKETILLDINAHILSDCFNYFSTEILENRKKREVT